MPTPAKGARLGSGPAHERSMLANLATALFEHRRIRTTEAKARRLRPYAERLVTKAKRGDLHARRQVLAVIRDKTVVHELFTDIAPGYAGRQGGYTRITKIGPRKGDNAPMAVIELVEPLAEQTVAEATAATKRAAREQAQHAAAAATAARGLRAEGSHESTSVEGDRPAEDETPAGEAEPAGGTQWKSAAEGQSQGAGAQERSAAGDLAADAAEAPAEQSTQEPESQQ